MRSGDEMKACSAKRNDALHRRKTTSPLRRRRRHRRRRCVQPFASLSDQ